MTQVNIKGIDRVQLLKALWEKSEPNPYFTKHGIPPPPWNNKKAIQAVRDYIDYFQGRFIHSDLSMDIIDSENYDDKYGPGTFQRIVDEVKKE